MRNRTLLSTLTAFVFAAFIVDVAQATQKTWQGFSGNLNATWDNDGSKWSPAGVPTASDDVVFPANGGTSYVVTVSGSRACQFMQVPVACNIDLPSGDTLTVGNSDGQSSSIAGLITLAGSSVLAFANSHTLQPLSAVSGTVSLEDSGVDIRIADTETLTNQITIQGEGQILEQSGAGAAFFLNGAGGFLVANGAGVLEIGPRVSLVAGSGTFQVSSNSNAVLRFTGGYATSPPSMTSPVLVALGTLDCVSSFYTQGALTFSSGKIQVAANKAFAVNQAAP